MSVLYGSTSPPGSGGGGGGVTSFNGRTGAVAPQAADYTPALIGAVPTSQVGAASGVAQLDATANVPAVELGNSPGVQSVTPGVNMTNSGTAQNPVLNAAQNDPTIPAGYFYQSATRLAGGMNTGTLASLSTGEVSLFAVELIAGQILNKIAFLSGATALVTGTHQWFALYDSLLNALCATSDDGATAWALNTLKPLTVDFQYSAGAWHGVQGTANPYTIPTSGLFYVGVMVAAATVPTLIGSGTSPTLMGEAPFATGQDTTHTGLTTPQTSPTPLTDSGGPPAGWPWFLLG